MAKIIIIDDEPLVVRVVRRFLTTAGYQNFVAISDSTQALEAIAREKPDVVLLDIMMPEVSGLDILQARESDPTLKFVPFIILSASADKDTKRQALELGATEFLNKPVDPSDLVLRVRNALFLKVHQDNLANQADILEREVELRTEQLRRSREQIIHCLANAAEFRDNVTGKHVMRVGMFAAVIAKEMGKDEKYCKQIELAAQLHDVGKIGIPDRILMSPDSLSKDEFEIMKSHCTIGGKIIEPLTQQDRQIYGDQEPSMLALALNIAMTHHEKWNGQGYPYGLVGEQIPLEGRITAVADVFDALTSRRPYKNAFNMTNSLEIIAQEQGSSFDPQVVDAFFKQLDTIKSIREVHHD
jgi:putative two-component system response regulator